MLNILTHGTDTTMPPLMIVHGLFGSARNWNVIAKRMSETRRVIAPDMRNHGNSFHAGSHSYEDMASDLSEVITAHGGTVDLVGHSMGGKASMVLALSEPTPSRAALGRRYSARHLHPFATTIHRRHARG